MDVESGCSDTYQRNQGKARHKEHNDVIINSIHCSYTYLEIMKHLHRDIYITGYHKYFISLLLHF